jgi:hypothetical protein
MSDGEALELKIATRELLELPHRDREPLLTA